tara:strand:- start:15 stop:491 length:477 start_codon:yes stop_codon:yes gene_type:complete
MPMFFEILVRVNGKEKWVDGRKVFKYLLEDYSKVSYGGKVADPYNTRIKKFYSNIPQELLETWKKAYPNVDIQAQIKKCEAWLLCNTNKAKKDFKRFTNNWLSKSMELGGSIPVQVDKQIDQQIKKRNEYMKQAEVDSAPQDWVKDLIQQTKQNMRKK